MSKPRKGISRSVRFQIFARDGFTCKYCGRQADVVPLEADHVIPVCQGGSDDPSNLITACEDCNRGKSGKTITQAAPTESDRLRLAQERNEQLAAAKAAMEAAKARENFRQAVVNYWCECTGRETVDRSTIQVVISYVDAFGPDVVYPWIEKATGICRNDREAGKYVSGCRRRHLEDQERA